ncbi:precorrin-2 dehydrogenase/sirohydrochlorin ferrochelatase family protein [Anaeroarcus burkinensis]|uniref:precorrin-2 dehydrogenase/sirohydrochlorin ferrochelatase family protein n=1 Tax=Anaeroarcus burkinensis TaxID=82376 RepID=UPI0004240B34|nr:bifunctional precorrin-2 dehydrogenase/sirohydrochlorin ferrochelatase [Anaeroarcus burkinensis]
MALYPINLQLTDCQVLVVGGGQVAERKINTLVASQAAVTVISPELTPGLQVLVKSGTIRWCQRTFEAGDTEPFFLVFCTANRREVNQSVAREARERGKLVNVADGPEEGNFSLPAQVRRGDLLLTVSTGGQSPALVRKLRQELAERYGPEYEELLLLLGRIREEMKEHFATSRERELFWRSALTDEVLDDLRSGNLKEAEERIRHAASGIGTQP